MSSESEIVNVLSSIANIFLKAVDALEGRLMMIEQRMDDLERSLGVGRRDQGAPSQAFPPMQQDNRRASPPQAYGNPQPQYGSPRQDNYPPQAPNYQTRPPTYPPAQQQSQGYPPAGQQQAPPYGAPPQGPQGPQGQQGPPGSQGPPGPRPPANPLNIRQAVTGELKDVFAKMRARAEGR